MEARIDARMEEGPALTVRVLALEDAAAFRALRLQALSTRSTAFGASFEEESLLPNETFRARLATSGGNAVFGAFAGDRLVGMVGYLAGDRLKTRHSGSMWGLFVEEGWRGHGLGRALVEGVIQHATGLVRILRARVSVANRPARELYGQLGFVCYGIEPQAIYAEGAYYDDELLALELETGVSTSTR